MEGIGKLVLMEAVKAAKQGYAPSPKLIDLLEILRGMVREPQVKW